MKGSGMEGIHLILAIRPEEIRDVDFEKGLITVEADRSQALPGLTTLHYVGPTGSDINNATLHVGQDGYIEVSVLDPSI